MKLFIFRTICPILLAVTVLMVGCGGGTSASNPTSPQGKPIDPSGNWKMNFVDSNNNNFILSGLFSQTGSVVTGLSFGEFGNGPNANPPTSFQCVAQTNVSMANGTVQDTNQFSGDLSGNFGTVHFASTLNDAGTHAAGTYTVTPGPNGNCLGVALTGTFTGDEVPSMTGTWTGTLTCTSNCPTGEPPTGTIKFTLTQDDATGAVTGTYTTTGLLNLVSGSMVSDINDFLSGASWQDKLADQDGRNFTIAGGPVQGSPFDTNGVGQDRSFQGFIFETEPTGNVVPLGTTYSVTMTH